MDDPWSRQKDAWLLYRVSSEQLLEVIALYSKIHPGDTETIEWLSTRGNKGHDLGGNWTRTAAVYVGGFVPRYR